MTLWNNLKTMPRKQQSANLWSDLIRLFFPPLCLLCEEPLAKGENHICLDCFCRLPRIRFFETGKSPACLLFAGKFPFEQASAFLKYEKSGAVRRLIHALKYHGQKELAFYLGQIAAREMNLAGTYAGADLIVPVPLHPARLRQRGYNQSEWIARGIASVLGIPVDCRQLTRHKATRTQTHKSVYERWENVQDIFSLTNPLEVENKHILLVDDVMTTGSTLGESARTLLSAPHTRISLFAIAIA